MFHSTLNRLCLAVSLAFMIIYIDISVFSVVLPTIQTSFHTSTNLALWVINAYALARAGSVFATGYFSDRYSHHKTFMSALAVFLMASLACALSRHIYALIAFRALQGLGASFIFTAGMSLVTSAASKAQRGSVIAKTMAVAIFSMALAPLFGGLVVHYLSWPWIFYLNLIPGIAAFILLKPLLKPQESAITRKPAAFDYIGVFLICAFVLTVNIAFQNSVSWGFISAPFIGLLLIAGISFYAFTKHEPLHACPIIDLNIFKIPHFIPAITIASLTQIATWLILFLGLFLQYALHYHPLHCGYLLLPLLATGVLSVKLSGKLMDRCGMKLPLLLATGALSLGLVLTLVLFEHLTYLTLLPLFVLAGFGIFMVHGPIRATLLNYSPKHQFGMINASLTGIRNISSAMGFAILSAIITNIEQSQLKAKMLMLFPSISEKKLHGLPSVLLHNEKSLQLLHSFPAPLQQKIYDIVLQSYLSGFFWMLTVVALLMILSFLLALFAIK